MSFLVHATAAYRTLERIAEVIEPDPLGDIHRRLARIEQLLFTDPPLSDDPAAPHTDQCP